MNITGGKFKNRKITTVKSNEVRPTSSKIRASIFNILNSLNINLEGVTFLDLFAGSGIMGLEALSRGAEKSFFVENNLRTYKIIKENIAKFDADYETFNMDALKFLEKTSELFDIIFLDPPYKGGIYDVVIEKIQKKKLLNENGILIIEAPLEYILLKSLNILKEKTYGNTKIYFCKLSPTLS